MRPLVGLAYLLSLSLAECVCAAEVPSAELVLETLGKDQVPEELVYLEEIPLTTLPLVAARAEIRIQVPAVEVVLVKGERGWFVTLLDKEAVKVSWKEIARLLTHSEEQIRKCPAGAARDLLKVLVEPSERFAVVLQSSDDIPTSDVLSDIYRDLVERVGEGAAQQDLRRRIPKSVNRVEAAHIAVGKKFEFYSWTFFGGEVSSWTLRLGKNCEIKRKPIAQGVGSWKPYY